MRHQSTKTYGHNIGLSACFRQWKAKSHCNKLHGYSLAFKLVFGCDELDGRDWVVDFGALREFKAWLEHNFDHCTLIAEDDPLLKEFRALHEIKAINLNVVQSVGCESFAKMAWGYLSNKFIPLYLESLAVNDIDAPMNLRILSVEVMEHGANSAIYKGDE